MLVPRGTPKHIIAFLHDQIVKALSQADFRTRLAAIGYVAVGNEPDEFGCQITAELDKWRKVVRAADISAD